MRSFRTMGIVGVFWLVLGAAPAFAAAGPAETLQEQFIRVAEKVKPSVVLIRSERAAQPSRRLREDFPFPLPPQNAPAWGTGTVVQSNGIILTNYHVVRDAASVTVVFDLEERHEEKAKVLGSDPESDLAVLQVEHTGLTPIEFSDSAQLKVGQWVLAVGNPFRQAQTVTFGIISAMGRHLDDRRGTSLQDYIQTDAAINKGNSGGPLVDLEGKLVGINAAILSDTGGNIGLGFAVPVNTIKRVMPRLIRGEKIVRGFLGIEYTSFNRKEVEAMGLTAPAGFPISVVVEKGAAARAGVQRGDIIISYNGKSATSSEEFRRAISEMPPGSKATLVLARPSDNSTYEEVKVTVTLHERESPEATSAPPREQAGKWPLGMTVQDVTPSVRKRFELPPNKEGAIITEVEPGGLADEANLEKGLFVRRMKVGGKGRWVPIARAADFESVVAKVRPGDSVVLWAEDADEKGRYFFLITSKTGESGK